jgi:hypothetical protein
MKTPDGDKEVDREFLNALLVGSLFSGSGDEFQFQLEFGNEMVELLEL